MALSGSFSGSIKDGKYKLRVDWSATQSISNNTSKITAVMYLVQASSWSLNIAKRTDNKTTINGTGYTWTSPAINNSGGKTTKLATVTSGNIAHNSDGTKSVTIKAVFEIGATISGTRYDTIEASQTVTLNTIPRATTPTLSASSVNMGSAITVSLPRASGSFTHDLAYKFAGSDWTSVTTGAGTSYTWTVPDLASKIPNATSGTVTLRCITKNGSASVGTKTVTFTAKVPASVKPTISAVTLAETTAGIAAQFGAYVQGKSKVKATITAAGAKGSSIKAYSSTLQGRTYSGASWTSQALTSSGSLSIVTKVTDSRGRTASKTTTLSVVAYTPPKISRFTVHREGADGPQEDGEYMGLAWAYTVASVGGKNTAAMKVEYKRTTATSWEAAPLVTGTATAAAGSKVVTSPTFSTDYQYDVRLTVSDWFGASQTYTAVLPSGAVIMDIRADGEGLAFFKTSERDGVEFGAPIAGQELTTQTQAGQYRTFDGFLVQWGGVTITPTAAGEPTTAVVTFPQPFAATPTVLATPVSSVPQSIAVAVQRAASVVGDPAEAVAITLTREGTTATGINWVAFGRSATTTAPVGYVLRDADGLTLADADGYTLTVEE